jgi:dolichyl-phosphate beta-glucosyltransferase
LTPLLDSGKAVPLQELRGHAGRTVDRLRPAREYDVEAHAIDSRDGPTLSLVLPAFNPGPLVERTYRLVQEFLRERGSAWEAIFVCDGCTDGTPERLAALNQAGPGTIRVLSYERNQGKGYAVRQGLLAARGQFRLFTDVDLAYDFEDVDRIAAALRRGADVAIASRTHRDSRVVLPPHLLWYAYRRQLQSRVFSWIVRRLLNLPAYDTQAGLKGMTARAARAILPSLGCNGFGFDCELLSGSIRAGLRIEEIPVAVRFEDGSSTTSVRSARKMLMEIWSIRRSRQTREAAPAQPPSHSDIAAAA